MSRSRVAVNAYHRRPDRILAKREYDKKLRATPRRKQQQVRWAFIRKYGIAPEDRDEIFAAQGHKCGSCGATEPGHPSGWCTDHDHNKKKGDPGFIRGVICQKCNFTLHHAATPEWLRACATYLEDRL